MGVIPIRRKEGVDELRDTNCRRVVPGYVRQVVREVDCCAQVLIKRLAWDGLFREGFIKRCVISCQWQYGGLLL